MKELSKMVRESAQQQLKKEMNRTQGTAINNTKESQWSKRTNIWQDAHLLPSPQNPKLKNYSLFSQNLPTAQVQYTDMKGVLDPSA